MAHREQCPGCKVRVTVNDYGKFLWHLRVPGIGTLCPHSGEHYTKEKLDADQPDRGPAGRPGPRRATR